MRSLLLTIIFLAGCLVSPAQSITRSIGGRITDAASGSPLPGASIVIPGSDPLLGASSGTDGGFVISGVPVGRHTVRVTYIGYEDVVISEILVGSAREPFLTVAMKEKVNTMNEVVIRSGKAEPLNPMASVSARQINMEEASRYAGGFNDPARLASSFAGVTGSLGDNGIVIRGNAPKGLLWRMEGVPISNPAHFANVGNLGAGAVTALSDQVMGGSDFLTGAFPAEYGNALSGVFDIRLRNGNSDKRLYAAKLGLSGLEATLEGPFVKGKGSTYLLNYRYSIFDLLAPILPPEMGTLRYHDLSFRFNFPTAHAGTFSVWGIGARDYQGRKALTDTTKWKTDNDKQEYKTHLFMMAAGLGHKIFAGKKTYFSTSLSLAGNGLDLHTKMFDASGILAPYEEIANRTWDLSLSAFVNHKFGSRHTNRTGIRVSRLEYRWLIRNDAGHGGNLITYADDRGSAVAAEAFSQSKVELTDDLSLTAGLHTQFFALNRNITVEPRLSLTWNLSANQSLSLAYGLHSQLEMLNFYLAEVPSQGGATRANRDLGFSKAHHAVVSWKLRLGDHAQLKAEPYFQYLFDIPVKPHSPWSMQNLQNGIYFNDSLVNEGKGRNIGIDITVERNLFRGWYGMATVSLFDSRYCGGDGVWRKSRFDRNYVVNLLGGREWKSGRQKNNLFGINLKFTLMGGDRVTPVDLAASQASGETVEDLTQAFSRQKAAAPILSLSLNYRVNKKRHAGIWEFSFINMLGYKELNRYYYDRTTQSVRKDENQLVIPNLSYRIEF